MAKHNPFVPVATSRATTQLRLILAFACTLLIGSAGAVELVDRNPFDPHRQPWKLPPPPPPELPALTPQDLQIEAIVSFGSFRGILAQLDGKLRGSLPGNSAGKVRIAIGQRFGAGYVLESVDANQAVVQGGSARFTIPIIRRANRGSAPAPAAMAQEQRVAQPIPPFPSQPSSAPGAPAAAQAPAAQADTSIAAIPPAPQPAPPPLPMNAAAESTPAPVQQASSPNPSPQPMSLLEAIQAAQAAARNQQNSSQPAINPFAMPKK